MKQNNKGSFGRIKNLLIGLGLALFLVSVAIPSGLGDAQGRGRVKPERVLPTHYPYGFDGMGYIDRIEGNEVVIDDSLFRLSPAVKYHTPDIQDASSAFFRLGSWVGFLVNSEKEISSLWLIE